MVLAPRFPFTLAKLSSTCRVPQILEPGREAVGHPEEGSGQHVAQLGAVAVGGVVDDRERQRVVEVLVVELGIPLQRLVLAERRPDRERASSVVVVSPFLEGSVHRISLARIPIHLLLGERAGQVLIAPHVAEIEPHAGAAGQLGAEAREGPAANLLAVLAEAVELGVAQPHVEVEGAVDLTGADVALEEAEGAGLAAQLDQTGVVAGLAHVVDRPAEGVAAEAQGVGALVDLETLGGQQLERLEVREAVRVAVGEAVDQDRHAAQVEVVAQAGAADRDLALVGGPEAGLDQDSRHEVERVLEVGSARLLDGLPAHHIGAARHALELLACLLLGAAPLVDAAAALHHHRRQGRSRRGLGLRHPDDGERARHEGEQERQREMDGHGRSPSG